MRFHFANAPTHLIAVDIRHHDIEQNQIRGMRLNRLQSRCPAVSRHYVVLLRFENLNQEFYILRRIIDHQDGGYWAVLFCRARTLLRNQW